MVTALLIVSLASPLAFWLSAPRFKAVPVRAKSRRNRAR